ncbi:MAG: hypothetical protein FJ135_03110 [Deltaproteobacteria bacterium]|nr:hypothetical protein [Deltaproteobacteria bacterium]
MEKLARMRLFGLLAAFKEQVERPRYQDISCEERFGLLVDREVMRPQIIFYGITIRYH